MNISIITTVKDDTLGIYPTIKSVINQKIFKNIEYVIVDASTKKETSFIIRNIIKNIKNIKYIKSLDTNLYQGINKGIKASRGKYIGILNSGDIYFNNGILGVIANSIKKNQLANIIFGKLIYFDSFKIIREWNIKAANAELNPFIIPHPACFIRRSIIVKNKYYSLNYNISSDLDFFLRSMPDFTLNFTYINKNIIFMREGGLSTNVLKFPLKFLEDLSILFTHYSLFFLYFYLKKILIKLPGIFFLKNKDKYYKGLLSELLVLSKK